MRSHLFQAPPGGGGGGVVFFFFFFFFNRPLQRSFVAVSFEISIDVVITEELRHDVGVVVAYCPVQCGPVAAVLNIHIYPWMVQ